MSAECPLIFTDQGKRLHFGAWAVDLGSQARLGYRTGRFVPICPTDQGVKRYRLFQPAIHRRRPLCRACVARRGVFASVAASTEER